MEHITGWKKIDRILNKQVPLLNNKIKLLENFTAELLAHKPVQYVLNEAWFYGIKLFVNQHVLIPRPETEELAEWIIQKVKKKEVKKRELDHRMQDESSPDPITMLDIGTGSGCIPIVLKKNLPSADVLASDISKDALLVAQKNAIENAVDVAFLHIDFLDEEQWEHLPYVDVIVSNPPYIPIKDKQTMRPNVVKYEPHLALFVEDNNPLIFYQSIAAFANRKLKPAGSVFVELHEDLAKNVQQVFERNGFNTIEIRQDMQGKDRMIKVER